MKSQRQRWRLLAGLTAAVAVVGLLLAGMALRTNYKTGRWGLTVSGVAAPGRVEYGGRSYDRNQPPAELPPEVTKSGTTPGGALIYADPSDGPPLEVYVVDGDNIAQYGLVGGP